MKLLSRCCLECFCLACMNTVFDGRVRCGILSAEVLIEEPLFIFAHWLCVEQGPIVFSLLFSKDIDCFPWPLAHLNCWNVILTSQSGFLTFSCWLGFLSQDHLFPPMPFAFLYFESFLLYEFYPRDFQRYFWMAPIQCSYIFIEILTQSL